ncbi:MAG: alpha/beta hydrolase, partial [Oxalobacteraceae bacterium]
YGDALRHLHDNGRMQRLFGLMHDFVLRYPKLGQSLWRAAMQSRFASLYARLFEVNGRVLRPADMLPYFSHLAAMEVTTFVRMLERIQHHSVESRLSQIELPALLIAAERDTFTPAHLSRRMHAAMKNSQLLVIAGASHVAPLEIPALFNQRIDQFMQDSVLAAPGTARPAAQLDAVVAAPARAGLA